jgi:hypothetical protein
MQNSSVSPWVWQAVTAVGSDEDAEVVVEEVLLLDPVAVDEAEIAIVEAAPVEAVELASSVWSWSWSCSSSEEAEAEAKVASLSPSSQCLLLSVTRIQPHIAEYSQYTGMEVAVIERIRQIFRCVFWRCHFPFFAALEAEEPFLAV